MVGSCSIDPHACQRETTEYEFAYMLQSRNGLKARFALKRISTRRESLLVALFYAAECQLNLAIVVKAYRCIAKHDYAEETIVKFILFI